MNGAGDFDFMRQGTPETFTFDAAVSCARMVGVAPSDSHLPQENSLKLCRESQNATCAFRAHTHTHTHADAAEACRIAPPPTTPVHGLGRRFDTPHSSWDMLRST